MTHIHSSGFAKKTLIGFVCLWLAACGGGKGSGSNQSGQKPDPVVVDLPIAYIKRPIPVDEDKKPVFPEIVKPNAFNAGATIFVKDRATVLAAAVNITDAAFAKDALYDVKDLSVSPTGDRLLFAMHAPMLENVAAKDQPTWNIWQYNLKTKVLNRVISSDIIAEAGDDISPRYLPDGRILFSSTRQPRSKAILLDDGKPQFSALEESGDMPAFVLHVMKDDGSDIQQITYNQSHDLQPSVLQDGRILFTRWDRSGTDKFSFYTVNPDGTQLERHYGYFSMNQAPAAVTPPAVAQPKQRWFKPQQLQDGRIAAILKPEGAMLGGEMVVIDSQSFFENTLKTTTGTSTAATAQMPISSLPVNITVGDTQFSKHGRFSSLTPLYDGSNRILTSWSECRLIEPSAAKRLVPCTDTWLATTGVKEAAALYGIWIYNLKEQSQQPVVLAEEGFMYTEPVALEPRTAPTFYNSKIDPDLAKESVGILHIRSVYDFDGAFSNYGFGGAPTSISAMAQAAPDVRPARFIRFTKAVSIPDDDTRDGLSDNTYGALFNSFNGRKEILGYAPIEPDGSVKVKVPADVALSLEILDKDGKRLGAVHNNWLQLRPGEVRECNGCHLASNLTAGHGRKDAELASINTGATTSGLQFPSTLRADSLGIAMTANMGETMAEFASRTTYCLIMGDASSCAPFSSKSKATNLRSPSVDLIFNDEWTDPAVRAKSPSFAYRYKDLANTLVYADLHAPVAEACTETDGWSSLCRVIINFEQHIQPILERTRDTGACVSCHTTSDSEGNPQLPSGQLSFARTKMAANQPMLSYNQLVNSRDKQILTDDGVLTSLIPACEFVVDSDEIPECVVTLDANNIPTCVGVTDCQFEPDTSLGAPPGKLLLDAVTGNPIPLIINIQLAPPMSRGGARASARFFNRFAAGGNHAGYLNNSELKLLSEWLDLRAQYYNNPFDSVEAN